MQYLLLIYDDEKVWDALPKGESDKLLGEYFAFTESIKKSGHFRGGEALQPVATATTVRVREGKTMITDGPFAETREQLGGYYVVDVADLDAAIGWAAKIPDAAYGCVEVRPIMEFDAPAAEAQDDGAAARG